MRNLMLGGPSFCRVCGHSHNRLSYNQCVASPRQKAQIAIENMEKALQDVGLHAHDRSIANEALQKLHKSIDIPTKPIYHPYGSLKPEALKKVKEAQFDPSEQQLYEIKVLLNIIDDLICKNGVMTATVDAVYKASFEKAKNILLKL